MWRELVLLADKGVKYMERELAILPILYTVKYGVERELAILPILYTV